VDRALDITPDMLATPDVIADPFPAYRALRDASPMRFIRLPAGVHPGVDEPVYAYAFLRHADVIAALRDTETFSSQVPAAFPAVPGLMLLHDDPPRHTQLRRLVSRAFTQTRVAELEPFVASVAKELIDEMGEGEIDVMSALGVPLPMKVIATMLGVPPEDYATYRRWSESTLGYTALPAEDRARNMREMAASFAEIVIARRERAEPDLISALERANIDGLALSDPEIISICTLMLIAGNETTTNLLGNMLHVLAERPELWMRARADRSLVDLIIEETLRFASPVQRLMRVTTREVEVAGVQIPKGHVCDIFYGAANRDPSAFPDPDVFSLDRRTSGDHVAFGQGIHVCLGSPLARVEARTTLNQLLDRYPSIALGREPAVRQRSTILAYGLQRLPVVLGRGGPA
jgi:cytochrome P450